MDGEYNKYPKYHGVLRFDDDNIFEITKRGDIITVQHNGVLIYPASVDTEYGLIGLVATSSVQGSFDVIHYLQLCYVNQDLQGINTLGHLFTASNVLNTAYAFKYAPIKNTLHFPNGFDGKQCDIWLNNKPANNSFTKYSNTDLSTVNVYCNFNTVDADTIAAWGLSGAVFHFNTPFLSADDFYARYK